MCILSAIKSVYPATSFNDIQLSAAYIYTRARIFPREINFGKVSLGVVETNWFSRHNRVNRKVSMRPHPHARVPNFGNICSAVWNRRAINSRIESSLWTRRASNSNQTRVKERRERVAGVNKRAGAK